jgi:FixJ family two-component response regulator
MTKGKQNKSIAQDLGLSPRTVEIHAHELTVGQIKRRMQNAISQSMASMPSRRKARREFRRIVARL